MTEQHDPNDPADQADVDQIKADVAALQDAGSAAADQIAVLTQQVLDLQAGTITDGQVQNLHVALGDVTAELVKAVEDSQAALGGTPSDEQAGPR
jgi:hypothetical protein